ncbi:hypothetical protein GCM10007216_02250 [Thalassobacillus devorans]|uniref:SpoVT-AbrB domain-containing protein n=1 Tax=Thalassobacillus devorans TaxID=279813 RepID=A0ABQ1NF52_9BACI|nr:hypothetical protein [Thalassobacillus devorans]NIK27133.1 bifunctional DNA-binding transcriptional regulator/antitoxin component of YhaV-PrlF toxin-antitoxin module [Thalassobacillus devorans]GGC75198.1 hypothetical protein GCM10007216_02250 [Thalassobacillus devorans]
MQLEKIRSKQLPKRPVVYMPVRLCEELEICVGEKVDITYDNQQIYIEKACPGTTHNKRYVTDTNSINIPKEIVRELGIEPYQPYSLFIDKQNNRFIISL